MLMRTIIFYIILLPVLFLCCIHTSPEPAREPNKDPESLQSVQEHTYPPLPLPGFLRKLSENHLPIMKQVYRKEFSAFCQEHKLPEDSLNAAIFHTLMFYHLLFTSATAANCSRSGILNIPYLWHWVSPNPRHEIRFLKDSSLLKDIPPPAKFARYKCYADIDRTPDIFLEDLVSSAPKYFLPGCGSFHTFGWCSEREMTFVLLMEKNGYRGKVTSSGNHTWTEVMATLHGQDGNKDFVFRIDNTFDIFGAVSLTPAEKAAWQSREPVGRLPKWYNDMAHAARYQQYVSALMVSPEASKRIESSVIEYFKTIKR